MDKSTRRYSQSRQTNPVGKWVAILGYGSIGRQGHFFPLPYSIFSSRLVSIGHESESCAEIETTGGYLPSNAKGEKKQLEE